MEGNGIDLMSSHNSFVAVLERASKEPAGEFAFMHQAMDGGNAWKWTVYGRQRPASEGGADGISRANQVNAITPVIAGSSNFATNARYLPSHYQANVYINYEDEQKNKGKHGIVNLMRMQVDQCQAEFFAILATDIWDGAVNTDEKIQSVTHCLLNTGSPGGIDQTDTTNNSWWRANTNSDTETFNLSMLSKLIDDCTHDTAKPTGIQKPDADAAWLAAACYSKAKNDMRPSQRTEVRDTLKGGAKYLDFNGVWLFRETNLTAGTGVVINTSTWSFRYNTLMPEPNAPTFIQDPNRPAIKARGYNWMVSLGTKSPKHNGYFSNKST